MRLPFLNKRITPLLPITIGLGIMVLLLWLFVPPSRTIPLGFTAFRVLYVGMFLLFVFFFGVGTLIFKTRTNGLLLSLFLMLFLTLRYFDLKHPIFAILLLALFIAIEFFLSQTSKQIGGIRKIDPTQPSHKARSDKK